MEEEKSEEKSRFPMKFDKCPYCGSEETIFGVAWQESLEKKKVGKDEVHSPMPAWPYMGAEGLMDPKHIGLTATVLVKTYAECAGCGAFYCRSANTQLGQVQMQLQQKPMPGGGPKFPFPGNPRLQ